MLLTMEQQRNSMRVRMGGTSGADEFNESDYYDDFSEDSDQSEDDGVRASNNAK